MIKYNDNEYEFKAIKNRYKFFNVKESKKNFQTVGFIP